MSLIRSSLLVEFRRLTRSGFLIGIMLTFVFCGLSGPVLARYLPQLVASSTATEQLTIDIAAATPDDGMAFFDQSAMQLGLIVAIALAVTGLGWDARTGSSVFYRTRVRSLWKLTAPRLAVDWAAAVLGYTSGFVLALALTGTTIGPVSAAAAAAMWTSSCCYLLMTMSLGYLVMTALRRTAAALALTTVLVLLLPALSSITTAAWLPTNLLGATAFAAAPFAAALTLTIALVGGGAAIAPRTMIRRDASG